VHFPSATATPTHTHAEYFTARSTNGPQARDLLGEPFSFVLGAGEVLEGWEDAVVTMRKGEVAVLVLAASKAYGSAGREGDGGYSHWDSIPPNSPLRFEIELLGWRA
jgi:FKBP-type peptidyl-prolyl cis-trans isomerase